MKEIEMIKKIRTDITTNETTMNDEDVLIYIERELLKRQTENNMSYRDIRECSERMFYKIRRDLSILQPLIEDEEISEIMVNGKDKIFIEKCGKLLETDCFFDTEAELEEVIRRLAGNLNREFTENSPIVDARLPDGSRINGVFSNIAINGPILTIRKFPKSKIDMDFLIKTNSLTAECAEFLKRLVESGYNFFISGGTSSGKTTFLNALSEYIPKQERIIVIEDSAELQLIDPINVVRLECREGGLNKGKAIGMAELIKTSLRMRPDRIIVGEVRDGKALVQMLQAMNTGHSGSLSTGHGNSVEGMLRRLESLYLQEHSFPIEAIQAQIFEGIDIMVHLGRLSDGSRKVMEVAELLSSENGKIKTNVLFEFSAERGLIKTENDILKKEKLNVD